jgi:hypothetical protein
MRDITANHEIQPGPESLPRSKPKRRPLPRVSLAKGEAADITALRLKVQANGWPLISELENLLMKVRQDTARFCCGV